MHAEKVSGSRINAESRAVSQLVVAIFVATGLVASLIFGLQAAQNPDSGARGGIVTEGDVVDLEKRAELPGEPVIVRPGDLLTFTLIITNNEPSGLPNIVVTDTPTLFGAYVPESTQIDQGGGYTPVADNPDPPLFPLATGYVVDGLEPDQAVLFQYNIQITDTLPAGIDSIANEAQVLALSDLVTAVLELPALGNPALTLEKRTAFSVTTEAPGVLVYSGETITWSYAVSNTGAVSLTNVALTDSDPAVTPTLTTLEPNDWLLPGQGQNFVAEGVAISGQYSNTGSVSGESALGEVVTATATSYYFGVSPQLTLVKTPSVELILPGETVTYTFGLSNSGNVPLAQIGVEDDLCAPVLWTGGEELPEAGLTLDVDEMAEFTCSQVLTSTTTNTATGFGIDPLGGPVTTTATATVTATTERAELELAKIPSEVLVFPGTSVTYTYYLTNTGDYTVTALSLTDDRCSPVSALPGSEDALEMGLLPGADAAFQCSSVITEPTTNLAQATGLDPYTNTVTATATAFVDVFMGGIALDKQPSQPYVRTGSVVTYTYIATNTGTLAWTDVSVVDDLCAPVDSVDASEGEIAPAESRAFACSTEVHVDTLNVATATATLVTGEQISTTASAFVDVTFYWLPYLERGETPPEPPEPPVSCALPAGCAVPGAEDVKALVLRSGVNAAQGANPAADRLYVLSQDAEQVVMLDPATFQVLGQAATDSMPWGMALNRATNRLYVSNFGADTVGIYDADTLDLLHTIEVEGSPGRMAILEELDTLFVLTRPDSRVLVIQGMNVVQDLHAGGSGPFDIEADANNQLIYISHRDSRSLSLLQQSGGVWEAVPGPLFEDGRQYFGLAWNPQTEKLYVVAAEPGANSNEPDAWRVEAWQPAVQPPWSLLASPGIPSGGALNDPNVGGAGIVVNPVTNFIYTANTGAASISRLEGVNDTLSQNQNTAAQPFVLAVDTETNTLFVGFRGSGQVAKVEGAE